MVNIFYGIYAYSTHVPEKGSVVISKLMSIKFTYVVTKKNNICAENEMRKENQNN